MNTIALFIITATAVVSCKGQNRLPATGVFERGIATQIGDTVPGLGNNIDCIFQDKHDNYWFASNGEGVYRYDGRTILHFTVNDGLCSNFVWEIQEDAHANLWFSTRDGVCRFDGKKFVNYTYTIQNAVYGILRYAQGGLFFNHPNGVCFYDGSSFTNFIIHPPTYKPEAHTTYRPYGVYCTLVDNSGKIWFGTQEKGVCVYDGKSFAYLDGKDLGGPAVRSIFQDKTGVLWFGNNGGGLYHYDGEVLSNVAEERNLGNDEFLRKRKLINKPGSLARVFAINQDQNGNIWIGTADAGVWKYDGAQLTNYTDKNGLSGNAVTVIYKDKKGELWFVSNGNAVCRFDGQGFSKVALN